MDAQRVRRALLDGYEITIDASTSEDPRLHRHAVFHEVRSFDEVLAEAQSQLKAGYAALRWTLRTSDQCIRHRGRALLSAGARYVPLCRRLEEDCETIIRSPHSQDVASVAAAKVMRFAALVLRNEAACSHAEETLRYVNRLLPHARVRSAARVVGVRP